MKILVVDDDATNRLVLKGLLNREGHDVLMAENGQEAVDVFLHQHPDMILMDVMMPVMDGYESTRIIKSKSGGKFIPVIFLTAMGGDEALVNCLENGGDDYLNKPVNRSVLVAKIRAMHRIRMLNETVNQQRHELSLYRERVETEQEVAEKIFSNIIKRGDDEIPVVKKYRKSADSFNGDIVLTVRTPARGINILVGDFTGHGLAAAIGAIPVAEIFFAMSKKDWPIGDIASEINRKISAFLPKGRFLAAIILQIDAQKRRLTAWNGGMPEIIVSSRQTGEVRQYIESKHLPLGVLSPVQFDSSVDHIMTSDEDRVLMFSDGVTETENDIGEMFGLERLEQTLKEVTPTEDRLSGIVKVLEGFRQNATQMDDLTLVELCCDSRDSGTEQERTEEKPLKKRAENCAIEFVFKDETLNYFDPVPTLVESVRNIGVDMMENENLFVIFSELYNNSLDHGVLGLNSSLKETPEGFSEYYNNRIEMLASLKVGWIKISVEYFQNESRNNLRIQISDSGNGFEFEQMAFNVNDPDIRPSGRGLCLLYSLCDEVAYDSSTNVLSVIYSWN